MNKTFDPNKPVQTRCGYPVTLLKTDVRGVASLIGFFSDPAGGEVGMSWRATGERDWESARPTALDLINVPAVWKRKLSIVFRTNGFVEAHVGHEPIVFDPASIFGVKVLDVEVTEGEGESLS